MLFKYLLVCSLKARCTQSFEFRKLVDRVNEQDMSVSRVYMKVECRVIVGLEFIKIKFRVQCTDSSVTVR